ncbi:MAG: NAD(P)H-dependent oxidoreductase subunit E [Candidatus Moranbacteria bacterium]|nr:NAD(P)H-dependent oxidoreductase subunit E [Candidatus Moranbacteria bacterium]
MSTGESNVVCAEHDKLFNALDTFIEEVKDKPGVLIEVLHKAQEMFGYLPPEVQSHVAMKLNLPESQVYGVVTFYNFFTMKPRGKHQIKICLGTACYVKGADKVLDRFKEELKVDMDDTLSDKLMAVSALLTNNLFHISFETWNNIVQVFNNDSISSDLFMPASIDDILWGCTEARILEGPEQYDAEGFSHDISIYVGTLLVQHGFTSPPSIVSFAEFNPNIIDNRDIMLSTDEFMFKAYWDNHKNQINSLEQEIIDKTKHLLVQLKNLPLKNSDNKFLANL